MSSFLDERVLHLWARLQELESSLAAPDLSNSDREYIRTQIEFTADAFRHALDEDQARLEHKQVTGSAR